LTWYDRHKRDLPWRRGNDPYHIWVSETMLQQTQVETVIPFYERFLTRWPTLASLAEAQLDDVLKMWEGLGYYARARNLHKGAQAVTRDFGGILPSDTETLRTVPGIGRYTAGAIASVAFGRDEPTVDANIRRVLARLFAVREDPRSTAADARLWKYARDILPYGRAGDFNQALMDLGSSTCVSRRPRCLLCPLTEECDAYQQGLQDELPIRTAKKEKPHYDIAVGVIWKGGRLLIAQRKPDGLLGGLWEFAGGKIEPGESPAETCKREIKEELGIRVRVGELFATVQHGYTHFSVTMHVFHCEYLRGTPRARSAARIRWAWPSELPKFAWPAANKQIIAQLSSTSEKAVPQLHKTSRKAAGLRKFKR
jgi:A/G-specific adenine glycosylase